MLIATRRCDDKRSVRLNASWAVTAKRSAVRVTSMYTLCFSLKKVMFVRTYSSQMDICIASCRACLSELSRSVTLALCLSEMVARSFLKRSSKLEASLTAMDDVPCFFFASDTALLISSTAFVSSTGTYTAGLPSLSLKSVPICLLALVRAS